MSAPLTLTATSARIPIAWVIVNEKRVPCIIDTEWARAFEIIVARLGGTFGNEQESVYELGGVSSLDAAIQRLAAEQGATPVHVPLPPPDDLTPSHADGHADDPLVYVDPSTRDLLTETIKRLVAAETDALADTIEKLEGRLASIAASSERSASDINDLRQNYAL